MPVKAKPRSRAGALSWATVDLDNPDEVSELHRVEEKRAGLLARKAAAELQALGIMDSNGRRIKKDLPTDMREDSECDL